MIQESLPVKLLLRGSYALALPRLSEALSGPRLKVLMYHGVSSHQTFEGVTNHFRYNVSQRCFESHLAYLARTCRIVSLSDVLEGRLSRARTNVLLTFDDGYRNNFSTAFPVLRRYDAAALFALPTAFVCEGQPLWNDLLEAAVARTERSEVTLSWDGEASRFDLRSQTGRVALLVWLMRRAVATAPERRAELITWALAELEVVLNADSLYQEPDYRPLEAGDVRRMVESGLAEFASHSVSHFMMARLATDAKRRELEQSKARVEELTGRPCRAFCVPGGSYDEELLSEALACGYESILTSDWGWADRSARTLHRCGIFAGWNAYRFADEVHGPVVRSLVAMRRMVRGR